MNTDKQSHFTKNELVLTSGIIYLSTRQLAPGVSHPNDGERREYGFVGTLMIVTLKTKNKFQN